MSFVVFLVLEFFWSNMLPLSKIITYIQLREKEWELGAF